MVENDHDEKMVYRIDMPDQYTREIVLCFDEPRKDIGQFVKNNSKTWRTYWIDWEKVQNTNEAWL